METDTVHGKIAVHFYNSYQIQLSQYTVSKVDYSLEDGRIVVQFPAGTKNFFLIIRMENGSEAHLAYCKKRKVVNISQGDKGTGM
jgi:hypothetical protein